MGRPKGSKNRSKEEIQAEKDAKVKARKQKEYRANLPNEATDSGVFGDRESFYEQFESDPNEAEMKMSEETGRVIEEVMQDESESSPEEEEQTEVQAEPEPETPTEELEEQVAEPEKTTVSDYVPEEVAEQPKGEERTVPLGALHEERKKRQELQRRIEEYEKLQAEAKEETYETDDYTTQLERRLAALEAKEKRNAERTQQEELDHQVRTVSQELTNEGYPWFESFGRDRLSRELQSLMSTDPDYAMAHDNPAGWKKLYKERVFPEIKKEVDQNIKETLKAKKVESKKSAKLVTTIGTKNQPQAEEKPKLTPYEEYMRERKIKAL